MPTRRLVLPLLVLLSAANSFAALVTVRSGAGLAAATAARDLFRADIGGGTTAGPNGSFGGVRREINWDGVPDALAAPNAFPPNFFNVNSPRGAIFSTPGTGFQVSASAASGTPVRFGNLDPSYPTEFVAFSPERLFTPLGQPVTDITFFVPGTNMQAATRSFGVMFTDVDVFGTTFVQLFGPAGEDMGILSVEPANHDVSFVGITFLTGELIARVRITSTLAPGPGNHDAATSFPGPGVPFFFDVVAIDDLIYAEPVSSGTTIPALSAPMLVLLAGVLAAIAALALRS
jgi:hypothetical protein